MMATRSGDVDPSWFTTSKSEGLTNDEMLNILNKKSGCLVSKRCQPTCVTEGCSETNEHAELAIQMFVDRVVRYIGQYYMELEGIDAIVSYWAAR